MIRTSTKESRAPARGVTISTTESIHARNRRETGEIRGHWIAPSPRFQEWKLTLSDISAGSRNCLFPKGIDNESQDSHTRSRRKLIPGALDNEPMAPCDGGDDLPVGGSTSICVRRPEWRHLVPSSDASIGSSVGRMDDFCEPGSPCSHGRISETAWGGIGRTNLLNRTPEIRRQGPSFQRLVT
jgi:hypothetical protein